MSASSSESRAGGPDSRRRVTLQGGPKDGETVFFPDGCARIVFPATWVNDDGTDMVLADWAYDRDGRFIEQKIRTETWGEDGTRDLIKWLWRDA